MNKLFKLFQSQSKTNILVSEQLAQIRSRVFDEVPEGRVITDADTVIIDVNAAFTKITGYTRDEVIGKKSNILSAGLQSKNFYALMWKALQKQGHWTGEVWNRKKSGDIYAERLSIFALYDDTKAVTHYIGLLSDVTSNRRQQEQLDLLAHYDVLTQLPNRALLLDRFKQAVALTTRSKTQLAICFLDLDNFKPINDTFGHHVGDSILIEVAKRMSAELRGADTVSRQGGDEFALLLTEMTSFDYCKKTIERILQSINKPIVIDNIEHLVSASIGVTIYPDDSGELDTLLRHADHAMYQAKQSGRNCYQLYNVQQDIQIEHQHVRLREIEAALVANQFTLFFQPKVDMTTGKVYGAEALIRWQHPDKGLLYPSDFLSVITGTHLEIRIGDWVIEQAVEQLHQWRQLQCDLEVSINISVNHLLADSFCSSLEQALAKYPDVPSKSIEIEVLESNALGDLNMIQAVLNRCINELGITVSLDDFGTGYSSLTHLRALPASTIKVDQSFVRDLLEDPHDYSIIEGVISLADSFRRDVIAEDVETIEQGMMLIVMGCNLAQGYAIEKAMAPQDFLVWMKAYQPDQRWITCASNQHSPKQKNIKLLRLSSKHWYERFVHYISDANQQEKPLPIMDKTSCHCGKCIKWLKREQLVSAEAAQFLTSLHERLHHTADAVFESHLQADTHSVDQGLLQLEQVFLDLHTAIEQTQTA